MKHLLSWVVTPLYLVLFLLTMGAWHPFIALSYYLGPRIYRSVIAIGNGILLLELRLLGTRISVHGLSQIPVGRPLIIVSNHQSLFDIPLLLWTLRAKGPCFIAKKELGRGIPSMSHALRNMGAALIDRGDPKAAISAIEALGRRANEQCEAAIIFPEGTRARNGRLKAFKVQGILALLRTMPDAVIVPAAISGSWRLTANNFKPIGLGAQIRLTFLPAITPSSTESCPPEVERSIESALTAEERRSHATT